MRSAGGRRKARASPKPPRSAAKVERQLEKLSAELRLRTAERDEALAQQAASAAVLQVINSSPGELAPVFDAILAAAHNLCGVTRGALQLYDGGKFCAVAVRGQSEAMAARLREGHSPGPNNPARRLLAGARFVQIEDLAELDDPVAKAAVKLGGTHTALFIPLRKDDTLLGQIVASRAEVRPFSESEIGIFESFAAQAVIAIENARLLGELRQRTRDIEESLEYQTATSDVLKVISRSTFDLQPVLETLARTAARLCSAEMALISLREGDAYRAGAAVGFSSEFAAFIASHPLQADRGTVVGRVALDRRIVHIADVAADPEYRLSQAVTLTGQRTSLGVPLLREDEVIGVIVLARQRVETFTPKQIDLVATFADQAVIAIENTRLLTEQREALERQTATAEVLRVINSSPGNLAPVFDAILENARHLCGIGHGALHLYDGERFRAVAVHGASLALADRLRQGYIPGPKLPSHALLEGARFAQVHDWAEIDDPIARSVLSDGFRTTLFIPLRKDGRLLGQIAATRREVNPFVEKEIAILESFAAQAVIAMENARLLGELRHRTRDLEESLEYQTATSDVLKVISRSTFDLEPVLATVADTAARLCHAEMAWVSRRDGDRYRFVTAVGTTPENTATAVHFQKTFLDTRTFGVGRETITGRVLLEGRALQIADLAADSEYKFSEAITVAKTRTMLGVPLLREGEPIGTLTLGRQRVEAFTERQIELVSTFADQAVIAIENTRLLTEQREALEQQTATAEVLQVINASPGALAPVFDAMLEKALRLCGAAFGKLLIYEGEGRFHSAAERGVPARYAAFLAGKQLTYGPGTGPYRVLKGAELVHEADLMDTEAYRVGEPLRRAFVDLGGARTALHMALRKDSALLGIVEIYRQEVRPFSDKEIALVQNFAAQAVIAMENARLMTETREALEQQTATAEVLQVINSSPGDLAPVFDAVLDKATRLCDFAFSILWTYDGEAFRAVAMHGVPERYASYLAGHAIVPPPNTEGAFWQFIAGKDFVHLDDVAATPLEQLTPRARGAVEMGGARTNMLVALRKDGRLLGAIEAYRTEVRPFSEKQVSLLQSFAAQAVIAMENARLITETREALERQTATADVLRVINSSPGDLAPIFEAILEKAHNLCAVAHGSLQLYDGENFRAVARHGLYGALPDWMRQPYRPGPNHPIRQLLEGARFAQVSDWAQIDDPRARALAESGLRTTLFIPLRKDNTLLGHIGASRSEVRPFAEKEIALLENFAAQAVIAMENARLMTETREALEQQTATAEVLQVINSSPGNLAPVFDAMLEKAMRLCQAAFGIFRTYDGTRLQLAAQRGVPKAYLEFTENNPLTLGLGTGVMRAVQGERVVHIVDLADTDLYRSGELYRRAIVDIAGARSFVVVPLLKDGAVRGTFTIYRQEVRAFSDKQMALLQNFAAQAVIAMENARLMTETREALEQQTATAEVLQVINSSPGNLAPVFDSMLEKAMRLCQAAFGILVTYDGTRFHYVAERGLPAAYAELIAKQPPIFGPGTGPARMLEEKQVIQIVDAKDSDAYRSGDADRRAIVDLAGARTLLLVPLLKDEVVRGIITIYRQEVRPFSEKQIALLQNFAAQAVIAMENARLITETREALEQQTATAEVLQVINSSPGDLAPVFEAILEKAHRLCGVTNGNLVTKEGEYFRTVAMRGVTEGAVTLLRRPFRAMPNTPYARMSAGERVVHIPDITTEEGWDRNDPRRASAIGIGLRTMLFVPLRKDDTLLGYISANRDEVRPYSDKEIALLESFAAQAVIAMENARLLEEIRHRNDELAEALEFQTATGEVLRIVASSPDNLQSVFDAMLEKATALCEATYGFLVLYDGDAYRMAAGRNLPPALADALNAGPHRPGPNTALGRVAQTKAPVHMDDVRKDIAYIERDPWRVAAVESGGARTQLAVPLLKRGELIGAFIIYRQELVGFAENQIALVTTFADQAVVAIENARLFRELRDRQTELARSVDELTATGDVLKIISRSSTDLETVLDTLVERVARLCRADQTYMFRLRDERWHLIAGSGLPAAAIEYFQTHPFTPGRGSTPGRAVLERRAVHIPDVLADPEFTIVEGQKAAGFRTTLGIPLLREDTVIGAYGIARTRVEPFTDKEIELATTFADQAVIAIENARLFEELRDRQAELARSVDELTATGDVLKIISRSSVDLKTVLDTLVETVARLCHADLSYMFRRRDDKYHLVTAYGLSAEQKEFIDTHPFAADRGSLSGRVELELRPVHIPDALADPDYTYPGQRAIGYRTLLGIPLLRQDTLLGVFVVSRMHVEPFTDKEIELATTFADQAVIAIENARLFEEVQARVRDLTDSLEQQKATSEILRVISSSPTDVQPVFDTIVRSAVALCDGLVGAVAIFDGELMDAVAVHNYTPEALAALRRRYPMQPNRQQLVGRAILSRAIVHVPDVLNDPEYAPDIALAGGWRAGIAVPLMRKDLPIGAIVVMRAAVGPFSEGQTELLKTFADQAVIAIENARLFDELRERQAELRVTFDNMGDGVAMFDSDLRLTAWNSNFQEILELPDAFLAQRPSYAEYFRYLADRGEYSADVEAQLSRAIEDLTPEMRFERTRPDGRVIEVRRNPVPAGGFVLIYSDITERKRAEAQISAARDAAEMALRELQTAQASLLHAQKMAALGQLTAGIAHEIKNPLNFVNNFASLSNELLTELREATTPAMVGLDAAKRAEIDETVEMLTGNLQKIVEHGRRADGIVKSMLAHSRGGSGDWQSADMNALVEEALNLAYHGARAQDQSFNITMEREFDRNLAPVEVVPQDVTRVFLNLIGNGFYAANKRKRDGDAAFRPILTVATRDLGDSIEIRVRDNGIGIAPEHRERLFQPFFTTKPTGEGTGLGLSISYDIITQQHGGAITVDSEVGAFTEFTVRLPRRRHVAGAGRSA